MGTERIMRHQLSRHRLCERRLQPAFDIDSGELSCLACFVSCQFGPLESQVGSFAVSLRTDGHVLTGRHRERAGDCSSDSSQQDLGAGGASCGDPEYKARGRDDSVIRAEDRGAEPTNATGSVPFTTSLDRYHGGSFRAVRL